MDRVAVLLVIASALLHATWNALIKRESDTEGAALALQTLTAVFGIGMTAFDPSRGLGDRSAIAWAATAGLLEAGYFVTLAAALRRASLGAAYTVARGGAVVLLWPLSVLFLGESMTTTSIVGAPVLLLGIGMVSGTRAVSRSGLRWATLWAITIAGYSLAYKQSLAHGAAPTSLNALSLGLSAPINLIRGGPEGRRRLRDSLLSSFTPIVIASVASMLSFLLFLVALRREGAGAVTTLRSTSVIFAILLSALMGEGLRRTQLAGAVLVSIGAVLVGYRR